MNKIPILLYHDVFGKQQEAQADGFAVSEESFRAHMLYLRQNGFVGVSLAKILAEFDKQKTEDREQRTDDRGQRTEDRRQKEQSQTRDTRKRVVLTFDDGDLSNHDFVLPLLKEHGFTATFFITINEIGKAGRMSWEMIYELSRQGMDVGSHGLNHTFLTALTDYTLLNELLMSKQILEKYTRKRVDYLSIPRGFYSRRVLKISEDVGFKAACVSDAGYEDPLETEPFLLKRFTMRKNYGLNTFKAIVRGEPPLPVFAAESARTALRKVLGWQVYDKLRGLKVKGER